MKKILRAHLIDGDTLVGEEAVKWLWFIWWMLAKPAMPNTDRVTTIFEVMMSTIRSISRVLEWLRLGCFLYSYWHLLTTDSGETVAEPIH